MLTATYSLVAISIEQKNVRSTLSRLRQTVQNCWKSLQDLDLTKAESIFNKLTQFDQYFHTRKVELYVIPAIRGTAREVDLLLAELESISACGIAILGSIQEQLRQAFTEGALKIQELCNAMEGYCDHLFQRLMKEEEELLPMVRRLLTADQWFPIATQFLSEDSAPQRFGKRYADSPLQAGR